jgi:hypothetical protein
MVNAATERLLPPSLQNVGKADAVRAQSSVYKPAEEKIEESSSKRGTVKIQGARSPAGVLNTLACVSQVVSSLRDGDRDKLFSVLDPLLRYALPCESFSLYLVEDSGKKLRRVHPYIEVDEPQPIIETSMEGWAVKNCDVARLPSNDKYSLEWAAHECYTPHGKPPPVSKPSPEGLGKWPPENSDYLPTVEGLHSCVVVPLVFGEERHDDFDYGSSDDSNAAGADRRIFGAIKLVNRLAQDLTGSQVASARLRKPVSTSRGAREVAHHYSGVRADDHAQTPAGPDGV